MRIVLAAEGTRGDIHPLLALGTWLTARGHEPVVCAPPDFRGAAEKRGLAFHAVGVSIRDFLEAHADVVTGRGVAALRIGARFARESLARQFAALPEAVAGADRVLGAGIQLAARSVAERLGVAYRYVAYCPIMLPSAEHPPFVVPRGSLPAWANRLAWRLNRPLHDVLFRGELNRQRRALGLPPVRDAYGHLLTERPLLAADVELAPPPADARLPCDPVPCLHPSEGAPLPAKLRHFLEAGPPPVFFGFGSMTDPDPGRTTREVLAAVERLGCRALIGRGWAGLGAGPLPGNVQVVGAVSHSRLFPRLAAVVHHGGAGTTTTAARAGIPQVVVPHVADQFYWARRVQQLGLGPPALSRRRLRADRLAAALAATFDNEMLFERTQAFGARLRAALPAGLDRLPGLLGLS